MLLMSTLPAQCIWYCWLGFVVTKAKCQKKPMKIVCLNTWQDSHRTNANDNTEMSQAICLILTHNPVSQPFQHTERSCLLARDYPELSNHISIGWSVVNDSCRIQDVLSCRVGGLLQKTLLPVPVFIPILPEAPALRWNINAVILSGALRKVWVVMLSALAAPWLCTVCTAHQLKALQVKRLDFKGLKGEPFIKWDCHYFFERRPQATSSLHWHWKH